MKKIVYIFFIMMTGSLQPCDWCLPVEDDVTLLSLAQDDMAARAIESDAFEKITVTTTPICAICQQSITESMAARLSCRCQTLYHRPCAYEMSKSCKGECPTCQGQLLEVKEVLVDRQDVDPVDAQVDYNFKKYYLEKYIPKASMLRYRIFPKMCPRAIAVAIENYIDQMHKDPNSFFPKNKAGKRNVTPDKLVQEISLMGEFIELAKVWVADDTVFEWNTYLSPVRFSDGKVAKQGKDWITLVAWWDQHNKSLYDTFVAFGVDYLIMQFNAYALRPYIDDTFGRFQYLAPTIEYCIRKLAGSRYENYYKDAYDSVSRINNILKRRYNEHLQRSAPSKRDGVS